MWIALGIFTAHLLGVLTAIHAVMGVRTAQGAIAWAVALVAYPYVAVPAYWIFGRSKFRGYLSARRNEIARVQPAAQLFQKTLEERSLIALPERTHPLLVEKLARLPFTTGNDAELLINGDTIFPSIIEGIARARQYVLVQFYIIRDDPTGRELQQALIAAAQAGVRCYLLYDEIGSRLSRAYLKALTDAGVAHYPFHTTKGGMNRFQLNFRNHRKIVVVDGREAWVGGANVGDEYRGLNPKFGFWRDTHVRLAGPVVQCVQVVFQDDWHWASGDLLHGLNWDPQPAPGVGARDVLCLGTGPADPVESCTLFFLQAINHARQRLWIASPYFVPDEQFLSALHLAALRGVDVRILIPDKSDSLLVHYSAWASYLPLRRTGIKLYRYTRGFMHQKVMVVDDRYCTVGTANFDNRSFRLNFEITIAFADAAFTAGVAAMLERDMADCSLTDPAELDHRGFLFRLAMRACRLLAPVQ